MNGSESTALAPVAPQSQAMSTLRPASLQEAMMLAERLQGNPTLPAEFQKPQSILLIILKAADMGLSVAQAFAGLHVINGRVTMASALQVGLVRRNKAVCRFFRCVEDTATRVTYETQRTDEDQPQRASFELQEAKDAGLVKPGSGWAKFQSDMLHARAAARLCRRVYQDVLLGMPPVREEVLDGVVDLQEDANGQWTAPPVPAAPSVKPQVKDTARETPTAKREAPAPIEVKAETVQRPAQPAPDLSDQLAMSLAQALLAKINGAKSIRDLEALAGEMKGLPEDIRAELRGPYRAARENLLRIADAPATTQNTAPARKPVWGDPDYETPAAPIVERTEAQEDREPGSDDE